MPRFVIAWGHSGTRGRHWTTAWEASRYAWEEWGEIEAETPSAAVKAMAEEAMIEVADFYLEPDRPVIHIVPQEGP